MIRYVADQYKTQKMCGKAVIQNGGTLDSFHDCYKNRKICNQGVHKYAHA